MVESIDELLVEAQANLRNLRKQPRLMTGPVERWSIPRFLDALAYMLRSLENLNEAMKRLEDEGLPAYEALQYSERFYNETLALGHMKLGSVIKALRRRELPEEVVRLACVHAYLHREVRQAITDGYGLIPLMVPEPRKPSSSLEKGI